jgi:predicted dehydrogenase
VQRLPAAARATLKDDLFRLHLPMTETDCNHGDQLTRELEDFIRCIRRGQPPRVSGHDARQALAIADCILQSIRLSHAPSMLKPAA